jgi:hypothetical protein
MPVDDDGRIAATCPWTRRSVRGPSSGELDQFQELFQPPLLVTPQPLRFGEHTFDLSRASYQSPLMHRGRQFPHSAPKLMSAMMGASSWKICTMQPL